MTFSDLMTVKIEDRNRTEKLLIELGVGKFWVSDPKLSDDYLRARLRERKGELSLDDCDAKFLHYDSALKIYDQLGLAGDCLRVAHRMNHLQLVEKYTSRVLLCMKYEVIFSGGLGIYRNFFGEENE